MNTLAAALAEAPATPAWRRLLVQAALVPAIGLALFAAWAALAPLAGAVVAPAQVKVEHNRKAVQHAEGGIVREILVRDGQAVRAGQALLVLADARTEAELALLHEQGLATRAQVARAEAEARGASRVDWPDDLLRDARGRDAVAREQALFAARRRALDEQGALLQAQRRDAAAQGAGLQAQIDNTTRSAALTDEELALNEGLARDGFVARTRVLGLQRLASDYRTRLAEHASELAALRQRDGELRVRAVQLALQHQAQAADELRAASARLREIEQRLRAPRDLAERLTVRAPVDGVVMNLKVAAAGAVAAPREPLLELVPAHEKLVFQARVAVQDIEHVRPGGAAELRLLGSDARWRAPLPARVAFVSPDRTPDPVNGLPGYDITLEIDGPGEPGLRPGMPAEAYVLTGERSLLQYLLRPLDLFRQRALREA